jgi:hypothetical protein
MKIDNSIMPMSDIKALAASGQKLRVAVTKTSAQGKSAQSTTPNLMSFSTDENSIWFNGKKYGVHLFKDSIYNLSTSSSHQDIVNALNGLDSSNIKSFVSTGVIGVFRFSESPDYYQGIVMLGYDEKEPMHMHLYITDNYYNTKYILINISAPAKYVVEAVENSSLLKEDDVVNSLTLTSTTVPLSAAMGKKLQDEKLAKSDVVNNLTTTDTSKALSAAQGKALNDRISGLGSVYRVKGTKTNLSDVLALIDARVGDVWNVTNAFTLGGNPYPANTNIVCIAATSSSDHDEGNWDPLGGTVNLSVYVPKSDIVDNLSTSDSKKPLSAKQGLALATLIEGLKNSRETYHLSKTFGSSTLSSQGDVDAILGSYNSFKAALNAGKIIHGIYKDGSNRLNTVAFSAFNDTTANRVRMYAMLDPSTMVAVLANHNGTNWVSATIDEGTLGGGITIE